MAIVMPDGDAKSDEKPQRVRLAEGQEVNLGCGTLILIALIVLIFGRGGNGDLEREVKQLSGEVRELKAAVEKQTRVIQSLQEKLDEKPSAEAKQPDK